MHGYFMDMKLYTRCSVVDCVQIYTEYDVHAGWLACIFFFELKYFAVFVFTLMDG